MDPTQIFETIPDITSYINLWLSITCFAVKQMGPKAHMPGSVRLIANDLIKIFKRNQRWKATDLNIDEATNLAVAIASLKMENMNFIADVSDIIKANIKHASNTDLIHLAKSSHYLRKFPVT